MIARVRDEITDLVIMHLRIEVDIPIRVGTFVATAVCLISTATAIVNTVIIVTIIVIMVTVVVTVVVTIIAEFHVRKITGMMIIAIVIVTVIIAVTVTVTVTAIVVVIVVYLIGTSVIIAAESDYVSVLNMRRRRRSAIIPRIIWFYFQFLRQRKRGMILSVVFDHHLWRLLRMLLK